MSSEDIGTHKEGETRQRLARLEGTIWVSVWILGFVNAALIIALIWMTVRGNALDADMNLVAAARGGG